ncbi:MAG: hypothetical protein ACYDFS_08525 [Vulcanimicrobiaceae bacterium]
MRNRVSMTEAQVEYAADERGWGLAYIRLGSGKSGGLLRVGFEVCRYPALLEREVSYAALSAVCHVLRARGVRRVAIFVPDAQIVADIGERRELPAALLLPYVRLRCELNQFAEHSVAVAGDRELAARARAEVALHVAA